MFSGTPKLHSLVLSVFSILLFLFFAAGRAHEPESARNKKLKKLSDVLLHEFYFNHKCFWFACFISHGGTPDVSGSY